MVTPVTLIIQLNTQHVLGDFLSLNEAEVHHWLDAIWEHPEIKAPRDPKPEITLRLVDISEIQSLNHTYRKKNYPTNVLSFPSTLPLEMAEGHLGDMVVCAPIIEQEAEAQDKAPVAHLAHMIIHSTLHLLGYTHEEDADAHIMEHLETDLLTQLGFPAPYGEMHD